VLRISIRQRRAASLAVVALGGCIGLAACGQVQLGSAAIVRGDRITSSSLATEVSNLNHGYHATKVRLAFPASQMPQVVLAWLLRFRIRDELAKREGITVSQGDAQRAIDQISSQGKQSGVPSLTALAVQNGLPPNLVNTDLGRYQAIANTFVNRLDGGKAPSSSAAQQAINQAFNRAQCMAAKNLRIKINPQFGRFDYGQLSVVAPANTLSAPEPGASPSPTGSPSPNPQFTPAC
jgi:hypothetical protein